MGVPEEKYLETFEIGDDHHRVATKQFPRTGKTCVDAPRGWLTLDIDDLDLRRVDPDVDVIADDEKLADLLFEAFDRIGLSWLISDCIIQLSSRHGLADRHTFKAHVEWRLKEPLTVAQQKRLADYVNARAEAAGFGRIADTSIYHPDRLLFTSPPELKKRVWREGKGYSFEPVDPPHGYTQLRRVRHIAKGAPDLVIPLEALEGEPATETTIRTKPKRLNGPPCEWSGRAQAGQRLTATSAAASSLPRSTRPTGTVREKARLREELIQQITAMPDSVGDKLTSRLAHVSPEEFERSWKGRSRSGSFSTVGKLLSPAADAGRLDTRSPVVAANRPRGRGRRHGRVQPRQSRRPSAPAKSGTATSA